MFRHAIACLILSVFVTAALAQPPADDRTYAEKLGWNKGDRVLILHVDDAGMSHDSNLGAIRATTEGAATSFSVMMPCPWVEEIVRFIKANPTADAGLHLTLTAEWDIYRWGPIAGKPAVPGLVDDQGSLYRSVEEVVAHATADEIYAEISAQLDRARAMGFEPTHLDSHMGTVFAHATYIQKYIQLGVENQIPVMFPGGHGHFAFQQYAGQKAMAQSYGRQLWDHGLPVLDDLHNTTYNWGYSDEGGAYSEDAKTDSNYKIDEYIEAIKDLQPGVTMMIMHCTQPSENFAAITESGPTRQADMEAMLDPRLKQTLESEGIILTTWRELTERRSNAE